MIKLFKYLIKSKLDFLLPEKKKILIYDQVNSQYFIKFIKKKNYQILYTRKEVINISIAILTLVKHGIYNFNFNYKLEYINFSNPNFIITMTDNDMDFLSYKFQNIKKIAIQNAYRRTAYPDIFSGIKYSKKKKYNLDYIFCFNKSIAKTYRKYLKCEAIVIGSLKNNLIRKSKRKKFPFLYISQYRDIVFKNKIIFPYNDFKRNFDLLNFKKKNFINITTEKFYNDDKKILNYVLKYLNAKKIELHILGVMKKNQLKEYKYFKNISSGFKFKFIKNDIGDNSYKSLDYYKNILGIDSTMLYEAFSRGLNVGFFSVRQSSFKNHKVYFGYPFNKKSSGICWTFKNNYKEVKRILDYLIKTSDRKYKKDMKEYLFNLTYYDKNNVKFKNEIKKILN
ncbi:hypothetical protein OA187_04915 [Candidatus Pelagibacter sp.]|nr:hypothetical protein [Candidatus Pelagibacter sp.]